MIVRTIAHYRITAAIGAGGMGKVYRATHAKRNREVALKVAGCGPSNVCCTQRSRHR